MSEVPTGAEALRGRGLFAGLDDAEIKAMLGVGREVSFEADRPIFEREDAGDAMLLILDGEARVDAGGRFHVLRAGDFFGEMALLAPGKRMASVRATTPVRALAIPSDAFRGFLMDHPRVAVAMLEALVVRLREVEQRIDAWMA